MTSTLNHRTDISEFVRSLTVHRESLGSEMNKNDKSDIAISACIDEGIRSNERIVAVLGLLGFKADHTRISLKLGIGKSPALSVASG